LDNYLARYFRKTFCLKATELIFRNVSEKGLKPEQFSEKRSFTADEGYSVSLVCSALADPEPTAEWFRGTSNKWEAVNDTRATFAGTAAEEENRYNFSLTIVNTTVADHDLKYFCRLTNKLGYSDSPKLNVLVNRKL